MKYNTIYIDSEVDGIGNLGIGSGVNVQLGEMVSEIQCTTPFTLTVTVVGILTFISMIITSPSFL